jgi:hypothetical protein
MHKSYMAPQKSEMQKSKSGDLTFEGLASNRDSSGKKNSARKST